MAKAKDLAGLAALGYLGFKLHQQGKGAMGPAATAEEKKSSDDRMKSQKEAVSGNRVTNKSSYTGTTKNKSDAAKNIGFGGGDNSDKNLKRVDTNKTRSIKADKKPVAEDSPATTTTTTSSRTTPGGDKKRTEGKKPMPSLKAVESRAATRKASMSTDAMKNTSRAQQAGINRQKAMRANPEAQAAERVYPEELLVGGPGVKVVGAAAKNLANRGTKEIAEYSTPRLAAPPKQLTGPSKADLMARDRAAREAARQEQMLKENASRYGLDPKAPGYEGAAGAVRRGLGGDDFTIMKRGGMTKMASGGMTVSRRGDGIATRGKTKCKMY
jgi:hypothetical protein